MKRILPLLVLGACAPAVGLNSPVSHPTPTTQQHSVGIAAGALYGSTTDDADRTNAILAFPYGEGWVRAPVGTGQLDFHLASGVGSLGYRFDVKPLGAGGVGLALEPSFHLSYISTSEEDSLGREQSSGAILFGAGFKLFLLIPAGNSFFYIVPTVGLTRAEPTGDGSDEAEGANILGVGGAIGYDLGTMPLGMSIELAFARTDSLDEDTGDPVWYFVPSVGFRL